MRADLRALLQRIVNGERSFAHPIEELVENLHVLESYGWVRDVKTKRSDMEAGHPWYLATVSGVRQSSTRAPGVQRACERAHSAPSL
jgi:hypothetical protein